MYARQGPDVRFQRNVRIPQNYSGNAFRSDQEKTDLREAAPQPNDAGKIQDKYDDREAQDQHDSRDKAEGGKDADFDDPAASVQNASPASSAKEIPAGSLFSAPGFRLDLGRFFNRSKGLGIGFEELLIIGLILLLSQSETKDDLIFLLLLLLFIQ